MEDKKVLQKARTIFNSLKIDPNSVLFLEEKIDNWLLKKLKKSKYVKDSELLKLINLANNKSFLDDGRVPNRADYVEKREIDRSTLYSFGGPFQLLHGDVGNLEFPGKNATFLQCPCCCWLIFVESVCLFSEITKANVTKNETILWRS